MFDAFTKVVAQADARGEFLNAGQIDALSAMVGDSFKRMDAVNRITSNASAIVTNAARALFDEQPALIAPAVTPTPTVPWLLACPAWRSFLATSPTPCSTGTLPVWENACLTAWGSPTLPWAVPAGLAIILGMIGTGVMLKMYYANYL